LIAYNLILAQFVENVNGCLSEERS